MKSLKLTFQGIIVFLLVAIAQFHLLCFTKYMFGKQYWPETETGETLIISISIIVSLVLGINYLVEEIEKLNKTHS